MNRYTATNTKSLAYLIVSPSNNVTLEEALYLASIEPSSVQIISPFQEY